MHIRLIIKRHVLDYYIYKSDYLSHNITIQSHVAFNFILIIVYNNVLVFLTYDICLTLVIQNGHIMSCQFFHYFSRRQIIFCSKAINSFNPFWQMLFAPSVASPLPHTSGIRRHPISYSGNSSNGYYLEVYN